MKTLSEIFELFTDSRMENQTADMGFTGAFLKLKIGKARKTGSWSTDWLKVVHSTNW
jgi:hypothetical protein